MNARTYSSRTLSRIRTLCELPVAFRAQETTPDRKLGSHPYCALSSVFGQLRRRRRRVLSDIGQVGECECDGAMHFVHGMPVNAVAIHRAIGRSPG